jgi:hypothetical protein
MARFEVVLEGLDVDEKALNVVIQRAVLDYLVDQDLTGGKPRALLAFRKGPDWYGIIAHAIEQAALRERPVAEVFE